MKIIATICAREGSKGIKNKNIRDLNGHPLIAYTIDVLNQWSKADRIIVSTDSERIASVAKDYGAEVPFIRPSELATDQAPKLPVIQHALKFCEHHMKEKYDVVIDLQPTSPLRRPEDIDGAFEEFVRTAADVLYTVAESKTSPYFSMVELDEKGNAHLSKPLEKEVFRRQDVPKVYAMNGSMYIFKRDYLMMTDSIHCERERIYIMDEISSIDIDTELDFEFVEFILNSNYSDYSFFSV